MSQTKPKQAIIDEIDAWNAIDGPLEWSDARFNELARQVFQSQFEHNAPYRSFCEKRGVSPGSIESYRDIPAVPTDVFKHVRLTVADRPVRTFRTSGTTLGERGEHHFGTLAAYEASLVGPFRRFCMPDCAEMRMLVIAPSGRHLPDSSLSFMLDELIERLGDAHSGFFVEPGADGQLEMRFEALRAALDAAVADKAPTMVLGTAFGFVEFFDACDDAWQLPAGSRVMETGGFKGKSKEASRDDLYRKFTTRLGIARSMCVSEYSMTELSSQAYSDTLFAHLKNAGQDDPKNDDPNGATLPADPLQTPPWARVEVVDPLSFEPIEEVGKEGLIRWYDLANTESVVAIQTADLGVLADGGGFRLIGRAPQAELRGCSLTIEEIVDANQ